jgi:beta-lactamase superfamily II metal-dependent hydrolase
VIRLLALLCAILSCGSGALAQDTFRVYFFDVGQGDAVFIRSPSGPNVLYDAGDSPTRILAHLDAGGVSRIDLVVASHNHADHIGGLAEVIRRFRPRFYLDNGLPATTLSYRRVLEAVQSAGSQLLEPTNRQIRVGDNAFIDVLPPSGAPGWGQNDNVVGLVLSVGSFRLSLGGDAERRQWGWWTKHYPGLLRPVHIHKASHHGSTNGDIPAALSMLSPKTVVISVGQNNGYGHPRPEALRLYAQQGSQIYRTDINGTVTVEVDTSGQYSVRVERGEGANPPPASSATLKPDGPIR